MKPQVVLDEVKEFLIPAVEIDDVLEDFENGDWYLIPVSTKKLAEDKLGGVPYTETV